MNTSVCRYCASLSFRISKFRPSDWPYLLAGKLPVRCRMCNQRAYRNVLIALKLNHESKVREQKWRIDHPKDKQTRARHIPA